MLPPLVDLGGDGPPLHIAIANGFPPQTYAPLLHPLTARFHVVCLPPRALWPDAAPPPQFEDWRRLAGDLLDGLRAYGLSNVIAIGHSFGGVASLLAALEEPARFRALGLLDPTILPPEVMQAMDDLVAAGTANDFPLAQGALRRRRRFDSAEAAYAYFRTRPLFANWPDATLRLYAEYGTRPSADGVGVELAWPPEWEAYYFTTLYTRTWEDAPRLRGLLPLLVVRGQNSDTFFEAAAQRLRGLLPDMTYAEIAGHGHLFPHTAPDETRRILTEWLDTLP
jgi:pimeloyl-ACP methyl ester carboxylesterase